MEQTIDQEINPANPENPPFFNHALRWGLIIGAINIIISLLLYIIDITIMGSMWLGFLILAMNVVITIFAGINYRNSIGGFMNFKNAFIYSFVLILIAVLVSSIFRILLFNVIDPQAAEVVADAAIENAESMFRRLGVEGDAMDEALEESRKSTLEAFSVWGIIKGFLWGIIGYLLGAVIVGAIIKKRNPEELI